MNEFDAHRRRHLEQVRALAATLPPDAAISHESAAVLLGYPLYELPSAVRVTRTRGRGVRTSDVAVFVAQLRPRDVCVVDGVPVTSGARTVVDLGRRRPFRDALVVADGAMRCGVTRAQMSDVLRHQWTWPRVRHAMSVTRHADARAESPLESVVRSRFIELGLPMPELQANIYDEFGWIARVDFHWPTYGVVGEADGRVKYVDDELWAEKLRQEKIEDAGLEVIRWNWQRAHASDREFRMRVLRGLSRGEYMRGFNLAG